MLRKSKKVTNAKKEHGKRYRDTVFAWWWVRTEEDYDVRWEEVIRERTFLYHYKNIEMDPYWDDTKYFLTDRQKHKLGLQW